MRGASICRQHFSRHLAAEGAPGVRESKAGAAIHGMALKERWRHYILKRPAIQLAKNSTNPMVSFNALHADKNTWKCKGNTQ